MPMPISLRSSAVSFGRTFSLISLSRNAASYFSRPRFPQPTRDVHNGVLICPLADIIGQAKQPVQVEGAIVLVWRVVEGLPRRRA